MATGRAYEKMVKIALKIKTGEIQHFYINEEAADMLKDPGCDPSVRALIIKADLQLDKDVNNNTDINTNTEVDANVNTNVNSNTYVNSNTNANSNPYVNSNTNVNSNTDVNSSTERADAKSSKDMERRRRENLNTD